MNLENKIEAQRKRMEQEKNKLDMLMKKAKMEQRKADNHRKIVVGANFETFLNEPRRYSEEQTRRIMQVAFATREVKNCMEQSATSYPTQGACTLLNKRQAFCYKGATLPSAVKRTAYPSELCVQMKSQKDVLSSAYKVCRCNPLRCGKGEDSEEWNN